MLLRRLTVDRCCEQCWKPLQAYHEGDFENLREIHEHPLTIPGVSDAGAHSSIFQDGLTPSHLLTHWARDRTRGPKLSVEHVIRRQCREVAQLFGLLDRGELKVGLRADLNVIVRRTIIAGIWVAFFSRS